MSSLTVGNEGHSKKLPVLKTAKSSDKLRSIRTPETIRMNFSRFNKGSKNSSSMAKLHGHSLSSLSRLVKISERPTRHYLKIKSNSRPKHSARMIKSSSKTSVNSTKAPSLSSQKDLTKIHKHTSGTRNLVKFGNTK
jgi:hypothetical protein